MTLAELHRKIHRVGYSLSSEEIPVRMHRNQDLDLGFELVKDNGQLYVEVKIARSPIPLEEFKNIIQNQKEQMKLKGNDA